MRQATVLAATGIALAILFTSAGPAFSDGSGIVNAQVTVASPCLLINNSSLNFGTAAFSTSTGGVTAAAADHTTVLTNCGTGPENFRGSATDASGGGFTWSLIDNTTDVNPCFATPPLNSYQVAFARTGTSFYVAMTPTSAPLLNDVPAGALLDLTGKVNMPCSGSNGAGTTMNFQVNFLATL